MQSLPVADDDKTPKCTRECTCVCGSGMHVIHTGNNHMKCLDVSVREYCRKNTLV